MDDPKRPATKPDNPPKRTKPNQTTSTKTNASNNQTNPNLTHINQTPKQWNTYLNRKPINKGPSTSTANLIDDDEPIIIRQEPNTAIDKTYINLSKQQEIIDYFHETDPDTTRKLLKNKQVKITLHTEGLMPSEIAQIANTLGAEIGNRSKNNRFTHGIIKIDKCDLNAKLGIPKGLRTNMEPSELMKHMDINPTYEQGTQVNESNIQKEMNNLLKDQQLSLNETILTAVAHPELEPLPILNNLTINPTITEPTVEFPNHTFFNARTFINYTNIDIPVNIAYMLGMGPKFAAPLHANEDENLFKKIEDIIMDLYKEHTEQTDLYSIHQHIRSTIEAHKKYGNTHQNQLKEFYTRSMQDTLTFFKDNKEVIASQTDKSKAAVLIYKQDYKDRMYVHLSDTNTYQKIKASSIEGYKILNEKYLTILAQRKYVTQFQKDKALREEIRKSNIYGLIKNHKPDQKIRPISNTRQTPGYLIAKTLNNILTAALKPSLYDTKNSVELKERLDEDTFTPHMHLASLDVISMFTNISFNRVENAIEKRYAKKLINTQLPQKLMMEMLRFVCCYNTEIQFDNTLYKQINGLRMGSPVSTILARIVMDDILDEAFKTIEKPSLFTKYVDDILTIARLEHLDQIASTLNQITPEIQFEMEIENAQTSSINYLELTIINQHDTTIKTKWYQKKVSSKRILNHHSQHAPFQIEATAKNYVNNMFQLTDNEFIPEIIDSAREILQCNNYPERTINNIIQETTKQRNNTQQPSQNTQTQQTQQTANTINPNLTGTQDITHRAFKAMPYVKHLSNQLTKEIKSTNPGMQIPSSTINTIQQRILNRHKNLNKKEQTNPTQTQNSTQE